MPRKEHHIVPSSDSGWDVKRKHAQRSSGHYNTKLEAEAAGRIMSINGKMELVVHGENGKIQRSDSHGNDPCPPKDK